MHRTAWQVILCVTALLLLSTTSGAQSPATSFDELRRILVPDQEVIVTRADGATIDAAIRKTVCFNGTRRATGRAMITLSPLINTKTTGASVILRF